MKNATSRPDSLRALGAATDGAALLEFTIFAGVFFSLLLGTLDFTFAYFQWNAATKAVQYGARLAAVSDPVVTELQTITGVNLDAGIEPGDPMQPFSAVCSGATQSCTCTGLLPGDCHYSSAAMQRIVYGKTDRTSCTSAAPTGMCTLFPAASLRPANIVIEYRYTGLGYAGRPRPEYADGQRTSSAVPTISVRLTGLKFRFFFLAGLMGFSEIDIPGMLSTATGEDLSGQ
jgi:hypothetical protein